MAEMHSAKKFHKGMRKMWQQNDYRMVENQPTPQQVQWLDNPTPTVQAKFLDSDSPEPAHQDKHHGKGKKCLIFATLIWLALVLPFLRLFKQFTVNMHKLHKVNKKCNEAQRQEVAKKVV
jgi:hypothetical protein